jgi:adenine-specific DNA-methyltransferase
MSRLQKANRLEKRGYSLSYVRFLDDFAVVPISNLWADVKFSSRSEDKIYVVQTSARTIERCLLMTTDPGDLILDPTCGSGATAYVAEQWGRRWITIDTSRVALALARTRLMSARYPYYVLSDRAGEEGGRNYRSHSP